MAPRKNSEKSADLAIIKRIEEGSQVAFEELVGKYENKVYHLALRFTRNEEDAQEVLQDVFTTIHRKLHLFQGKSAFSSWMYRIVVNAAFMKLRKRRQAPTISVEDLSPNIRQSLFNDDSLVENHTDRFTQDQEIREILRNAIDKLPEQYRLVFVLRDVNGLSNQEASQILNLSIPAVKSRLHRSRIMLRKKLYRYYLEFAGKRTLPAAILEEMGMSESPSLDF